jgi:hypothetical protein
MMVVDRGAQNFNFRKKSKSSATTNKEVRRERKKYTFVIWRTEHADTHIDPARKEYYYEYQQLRWGQGRASIDLASGSESERPTKHP